MTLQQLAELAEKLGATIIPDDADGPEFIFDCEAFERFTDAVFLYGTDHGLLLAQRFIDETGTEQ